MKAEDWDDTEIGRLARLYRDRNVHMDDLLRQLPGRTMNAIRLKASRLGLRREELDILRISELNWAVHHAGDRLDIMAKDLQLSEAVGLVLQAEDLEATGWEGTIPQVTIKRA